MAAGWIDRQQGEMGLSPATDRGSPDEAPHGPASGTESAHSQAETSGPSIEVAEPANFGLRVCDPCSRGAGREQKPSGTSFGTGAATFTDRPAPL